ncbi:MAG: hypothetical protein GXP45_08585 [bacterium]|nr:hypothetical protein [bacterium]
MYTKKISLEEYQSHMGALRKKACEEKTKYIILEKGKELFEVTPILHEHEPDEVDCGLYEIRQSK